LFPAISSPSLPHLQYTALAHILQSYFKFAFVVSFHSPQHHPFAFWFVRSWATTPAFPFL
jgi:hypothetical protein